MSRYSSPADAAPSAAVANNPQSAPAILAQRDVMRETILRWRRNGQRIALVPTMGNLHPGHLSLVKLAQAHADQVVVSIFVNPTQFGPQEDFSRYPRTLEADREQLQQLGVSAIFVPDTGQIYPHGPEQAMLLRAPASLSETLCGLSRPGHFDGVVTVVSRLFNLVQPDSAVFGEKDYQQLLIIEHMRDELCYPVDIIRGATVRETGGLALSSRNQYLDAQQHQLATTIYAELSRCAKQLSQQSEQSYPEMENTALEHLARAGLEPEYFCIRRADNLQQPGYGERGELRILAAARLGTTRLIDNIGVTLESL